VDDGVGVITVIGGHVACNHLVRLEQIETVRLATQSSCFIDVGAMRVESELVESSQTGVNVEWG